MKKWGQSNAKDHTGNILSNQNKSLLVANVFLQLDQPSIDQTRGKRMALLRHRTNICRHFRIVFSYKNPSGYDLRTLEIFVWKRHGTWYSSGYSSKFNLPRTFVYGYYFLQHPSCIVLKTNKLSFEWP